MTLAFLRDLTALSILLAFGLTALAPQGAMAQEPGGAAPPLSAPSAAAPPASAPAAPMEPPASAPVDPGSAPAQPGSAPVAPTSAPSINPPMRPLGGEFELKVRVNRVDEAWKKAPLGEAEVLLEVFAGESRVRTYTGKTGADGVATFPKLFRIQGARYTPVVVYDGVRYAGAAIAPSGAAHEATIDVYGKTYEDSGLVVTDQMTTIEAVENFLVFMQMWTFTNTAPQTFDVTNSPDPKYAEGLVIDVPRGAEQVVAFVVRPDGQQADAKVVENHVYVKEAIPPAGEGEGALRVRIHFAMKLTGPDFTFEQPILYNVEGMRIIAAVTTAHKRHPRLNLTMEAPGFPSIGRNQQMPGMRSDLEFLVARDRAAKPGEELRFTIRGYPSKSPTGRWLALVGALAALVLGGVLFARERQRLGRGQQETLRFRALEDEREALYDALRDLDARLYNNEITDRQYDIDVARLRERLALVLRRLDDLRGQRSA